jgi:hypothetical protein
MAITRRLALACLTALTWGISCSRIEKEPLPKVLGDADRPTLAEVRRAEPVSVCTLATVNNSLDGELVRVKGHYYAGHEASLLLDSSCMDVWVDVRFDMIRARRLTPAGAERMDSLAGGRQGLENVDLAVVFVGPLRSPKPGARGVWHLGSASVGFTVYAIESVEPASPIPRELWRAPSLPR